MIGTNSAQLASVKFAVFRNFPYGTELGKFAQVFAGDQYPLMAGPSGDLVTMMIVS